MLLVVSARLPEALLAEVRAAAGHDVRVEVMASEPDLGVLADADAVLAGTFTPAMLAAAARLRWVHTTGAGVERLLFPELVESDVTVTNARGAHRIAMPEYVLMAMLAWTHHLPALVRVQQRREWIKPVPGEVFGTTLGLLGYGEIGRAVAQRASALGVRCLACRRHPDRRHDEPDSTSGTDAGLLAQVYGPGQLLEFLGECDFVVNSLPLTHETRGIIGERELQAMRPGAVLINLGRGPTVQEAALLEALRSRRIAGAFLDVFDEEPLPSTSPFWSLDNAVITSHTSGNSVHYLERSIDIFCDNLRRFRAGRPLRNIVDKRLGY
jgi:phosphoglycerate dehydrogenase-like enzyme